MNGKQHRRSRSSPPQKSKQSQRRVRSLSRTRTNTQIPKRVRIQKPVRTATHLGNKLSQAIMDHVRKLVPIVRLRDEKKKSIALASSVYFADSKDVKTAPLPQLQKELQALENEIKLMASVVKAGLGNRPIRIKLWVPFVITTTVTSGITNTVTLGAAGSAAIQPSFCSEWPSLVSLFDEYRMHGGTLQWLYNNPVSPTSLNANGASSIPAIGYDPTDGTVANAVNTVCQLAQHKMYATANDTWAGFHAPAKHEFSFRIPSGVMIDEAPTGSTAYGSEWIACDAASAIHGWIKHYHQGAVITAVGTGAGQASYDLEFRCRS
jgi:5-methylcytosine-specific restriction endonuclease McrA